MTPTIPPADAGAEPDFDVAVVGAGAAGIAAALAIAREGFATALVGPPGPASDGRTVALLAGSVRLLEALDAWEALRRGAAPLAVLRIVDDTGSLFRPPPVAFRAEEIGLEAFGWNVESAALVAGLRAVAERTPNLAVIPGEATGSTLEADRARVALADGSALTARLAVAADGARSRLREAAGVPVRTWRYPQGALTAILAHARPHGDASTEFHTRQGPFTLVPLPNDADGAHRSSLVWMTGEAEAERLAGLPDDAFAARVERQAHSMLGGMRVAGPRGLVPMRGLVAERAAGARLALVGEAGHAFPPIGAQGLNLGMRDAAALRDALAAERGDPGGDAALAAYASGRRLDVRLRGLAVDALNRSLLADFLPVDFARGAGLIALGAIGPLRRRVMREGVLPSVGAPALMRAGR